MPARVSSRSLCFYLLNPFLCANACIAGYAVAAFDGFEFLYGLFDVVLCRIAVRDFHLCRCDPHRPRVLVVAQDQKFPECVVIVGQFKIIFCDGILDTGFFVFYGHEFEQGPKFCNGLRVVAFVGEINGADVDAGVQGKGILGKFADELARKVDGEVVGVEVAVIFCEFVEDAGFFGLGEAFFYGVAIGACREVVFFRCVPKMRRVRGWHLPSAGCRDNFL